MEKALYRFVGACERSMRVRVGVAFLFPGRERANGSCDNFDAYATIKDCLSACIFPNKGGSAKTFL